MGFFSDIFSNPLSVVKSVIDPLGIGINNTGDGTIGKINKVIDFDVDKRWRSYRDDPGRGLLGWLGDTPLGTDIYNKTTGRDAPVLVEKWGGPANQTMNEADAAGIDTGDFRGANSAAQTIGKIAGMYGAGNALFGGSGSVANGVGPDGLTPLTQGTVPWGGSGIAPEVIAGTDAAGKIALATGAGKGAMTLAQLSAATGLSASEIAAAGGMTSGSVAGGAASGGLLDTIGGALKPVGTAISGINDLTGGNLGGIIGGLVGAAAGGDTTTSTQKDPWAPAQPYLKDNLAQNKRMQDYYSANPFSQEQKQAYQGLLNTNANGLSNAGNFNQIAQNFMGSNRGLLGQMPTLNQGVNAPQVDWTKYANIGNGG